MKHSKPFGFPQILGRALLCALLCLNLPLAWAGITIQHWTAPSGARVFFVETHALPMLDVQIDFAAGTAYDPPGKAGTAALTQTVIDLGAEGMDETAISNRLADLGAMLSGNIDRERASIGLRTLSAEDKRTPALNVLRAVLSTPQFPEAVFEREQARSVAALKESLTQPDTIVNRTFWAALYPDHPYGVSATPESVAAVQRNDLAEYHRQHFTARRAVVSIVGDVTRAQAETLAQHLTEALPTSEQGTTIASPPPPSGKEERIAHPSSAQAHLMLGTQALKRGDPDFFALQVGNYTLGGGGFVSRLMKEVREMRGYAYSVHSYFIPMTHPGPFRINLQTKKTQVNEALALTRKVLTDFLRDGPNEAEIKAAKQNLIGSFPLNLDTNRKILDNVAIIGFYGLPLDYLDHYAENIEKVTAADIKAAFARHVDLKRLVTVLVGAE